MASWTSLGVFENDFSYPCQTKYSRRVEAPRKRQRNFSSRFAVMPRTRLVCKISIPSHLITYRADAWRGEQLNSLVRLSGSEAKQYDAAFLSTDLATRRKELVVSPKQYHPSETQPSKLKQPELSTARITVYPYPYPHPSMVSMEGTGLQILSA